MTIKQVIVRISIIILLVEILIMVGLSRLPYQLPEGVEVLLDAFVLVLLSTPIIYLWVIKPFVIMRDKAMTEINYMASNDSLTGLPNREKFLTLLEHTIMIAASQESKIAVLLLDLNRFKVINQTFGHSVANQVIRAVAERLHELLASERFIARIGPDQFAVLVQNIESDDEIYLLAKSILSFFEKPIEFDDHNFTMEACIGISEYPKDASDSEALLRCANNAMRQAKAKEEEGIGFYTLGMTEMIQKHFSLEEGLRQALVENNFFLLYQPKVNAKTEEIVGVEALIRWDHPERGLINPAEFIPLAEETGLIIPIGQWVLYEAISQLKIWMNEGRQPIVMSINLSGRQLNPEQIEHIIQILKASDISMKYIEFEITETYLMKDIERSQELLEKLHASGVSISLDDFGTGYSSLGYLKRFKIDTLKIDQMLIREIETDANDFAIAEAIVGIGHVLDLKVIAEGVETQKQMQMLKDVGCDYFQGYYFSKPVSADDVFSGDKYKY